MMKLIDLIDQHFESYQIARPLRFTDLDEAVIGTVGFSLVYSKRQILDLLETRHKMKPEEAREFFDFNIGCAYFGNETPIIVDDIY